MHTKKWEESASLLWPWLLEQLVRPGVPVCQEPRVVLGSRTYKVNNRTVSDRLMAHHSKLGPYGGNESGEDPGGFCKEVTLEAHTVSHREE